MTEKSIVEPAERSKTERLAEVAARAALCVSCGCSKMRTDIVFSEGIQWLLSFSSCSAGGAKKKVAGRE